MPFSTDNRWSPGASGVEPWAETSAAYSARWIDRGNRVEILPDRQGFAYNDGGARDRLIERLTSSGFHADLPRLADDTPTAIDLGNDGAVWHLVMRRAGGYIYVDAWLS